MVTSAKMEKTIVVKVTRATQHPLYHRVVRIGEEVLRARRKGRSAAGRHGANCGHAAAFEAEALAAHGSGAALDARGLSSQQRLREHDNDSDANLADGGR